MTTQELAPPAQNYEDDPTHWVQVEAAITGLGLSTDVGERASQISNITGEGLMQAVSELHGSLAPAESNEPSDVARTIKDRDGNVTATLMEPEEREAFFSYAATLINGLKEQGGQGDEQALLDRAGNIAALATVLTHTYVDGNGRTARVLGEAIRSGFDGSEDAKNTLKMTGTNRPETGYRINSYLPKREAGLTSKQILEAAAATQIPLWDVQAYDKFVHNKFSTPYAI